MSTSPKDNTQKPATPALPPTLDFGGPLGGGGCHFGNTSCDGPRRTSFQEPPRNQPPSDPFKMQPPPYPSLF